MTDPTKRITPACPACRNPFPMCDDRAALILHYRHDRGSQECCEGSYAPVTPTMRVGALESMRAIYAKWRDDSLKSALESERTSAWNRGNAARHEVDIVAIDEAIVAAKVST